MIPSTQAWWELLLNLHDVCAAMRTSYEPAGSEDVWHADRDRRGQGRCVVPLAKGTGVAEAGLLHCHLYRSMPAPRSWKTERWHVSTGVIGRPCSGSGGGPRASSQLGERAVITHQSALLPYDVWGSAAVANLGRSVTRGGDLSPSLAVCQQVRSVHCGGVECPTTAVTTVRGSCGRTR